MTQVHDFNPGVFASGLFWTIQIPDDAVKVTGDTLTISLENVSVVDQQTFPNPGNLNLGTSGTPATVSFTITYQRTGAARHVRATSADPLSPFNWAGKMWKATNSGTFSVAYNDGSFKAKGSFESAGNFGEMGTEKNGLFVRQEDRDEGQDPGDEGQKAAGIPLAAAPLTALAAPAANSPKFRGKIPTEYLVH